MTGVTYASVSGIVGIKLLLGIVEYDQEEEIMPQPTKLVPRLTKSQPTKVLEFLKVPTRHNRTHGFSHRAGDRYDEGGEKCEHLCLHFDPSGTVTCRICGCE